MVAWWLVVALVAASWRTIDACSCMPTHPQIHYCDSDFVIVARVEKVKHLQHYLDSYRINVRRVFKATEKAAEALKSHHVLVPSQESLCGVTLKPKETYILTGRIVHLQAHISLCNFHAKWREVPPRQRKGFRQLYGAGCACKVRVRMMGSTKKASGNPNTCLTNYDDTYDCYERHSICLHDRNGKCKWTPNQRLRKCIQTVRYNGTMT